MQDRKINLTVLQDTDQDTDPEVIEYAQSKEYLAQRKKYIDNYIKQFGEHPWEGRDPGGKRHDPR